MIPPEPATALATPEPEGRRSDSPKTLAEVYPLAARVLMMLAATAIVPAASFLAMVFLEEYYSVDGFHVWLILWAVGITLATIAIWQRAVHWALGRSTTATLVATIPLAQAIVAQPIWSTSGCGTDEVLLFGQHNATVGIWVWLTVWVWWGYGRFSARLRNDTSHRFRRLVMTPLAKRLVVAVGMLPFIFGMYFVVWAFADDVLSLGDTSTMIVANLFCAPLTFTIWILLWRRSVAWNTGTIVRTSFACVCCLVLLVLVPLLPEQPRNWIDPLRYFLPLLLWGIWLVWTTWIWPMRCEAVGGDVETMLRCPQCSYSLIGLTSTRCPECGDEPTLDQLWTRTLALDVG